MKYKLLVIPFLIIFTLVLSYLLFEKDLFIKNSSAKNQIISTALHSNRNNESVKDIIIVFKSGTSKKQIGQTVASFNGKIIQSMQEIENYKVQIKNSMSKDELLNFIESLNKNKNISLAVLDSKVETGQSTFLLHNSNSVGNEQIFDKALSIYNQPADVFYSPDGTYSFLYPSQWYAVSGNLTYSKYGKILMYSFKKSSKNLMNIEMQNKIQEDKKYGFLLNGTIDQYTRGNLIISKWLMNKDDIFLPRALIQSDDFYYYFVANQKVSFDEFALIVDSFVIN